MNIAAIAQRAVRTVPAALRATATFSRVVPGTYDPLTDTRTGDTTQSFTVSGPLVALQADQLAGVSPDELTTFRQLIIAAADCAFTPSAKDTTCVIAGATWRVVDCLPVDPTGAAPAVYSVRLHR